MNLIRSRFQYVDSAANLFNVFAQRMRVCGIGSCINSTRIGTPRLQITD
jgi:hypothetical protein